MHVRQSRQTIAVNTLCVGDVLAALSHCSSSSLPAPAPLPPPDPSLRRNATQRLLAVLQGVQQVSAGLTQDLVRVRACG